MSLHSLLAFLLPLAVAAAPNLSAASYYVPRLPGLPYIPGRLHLYAGEIVSDPDAAAAPATDVLAHIFFVLVKARKTADKERVIFWFNGGPGCSSFDGLMMEIGPFRTDGSRGLKYVDGGWEEYANVVFIDQPPGTGLSYTSTNHYVHGLKEASTHVITFLRTFYDIFPEFRDMDTYLAGESYAGQFIPYFADAILSSNLPTPLKGLAIGNGWIDPVSQYPAYMEFALLTGIMKSGSEEHKKAIAQMDLCVKSLEKGPRTSTNECEAIMRIATEALQKPVDGEMMCMNVYDIRLVSTFPACGMDWPPDLKDIYPYLARRDVVEAFHAGVRAEAWVECDGKVGSELRVSFEPSISLLPGILQKIPVLLFAGDQDFICNYLGIEHMIDAMQWNGATGLGNAETLPWTFNGTAAGTWVSARNLTYAKVYNSSHMVPFDVPHITHDMMLRFMNVDFTALGSGSANLPSSVGNVSKPMLDSTLATAPAPGQTKSPKEDQAMWDAYYNAGSAVLVILLIAVALGLFFFCRNRRRSHHRLPQDEETIPLSQTEYLGDTEEEVRKRKGKGRADRLPERNGHPVFDVGDSDEEYEKRP